MKGASSGGSSSSRPQQREKRKRKASADTPAPSKFDFSGQPPQKKFNKEKKNFQKKDKNKKFKNKGETLACPSLSFEHCWTTKLFSEESMSLVCASGLDISSAVLAMSMQRPGRITDCLPAWKTVTNDSWVLAVITDGYKLQLTSDVPTPWRRGNPPTDVAGQLVLDAEVATMLQKGAIQGVVSQDNEVVSPFFARPKKTPGKWRPIVSLKHVNKYIRYVKFRMTTVPQFRPWVREGYFFHLPGSPGC